MKQTGCAIALLAISGLSALRIWQVVSARWHPVDALLVPGGTPYRERYAAQLSRQHPELKVLVSAGSPDPCVWLIYDKAAAPKANVWTEHCAKNTFENFMYAIPILKSWHAHRVQVLSEEPQIQRVRPMANVMLGSNGILAEPVLVPNTSSEPLHHPVWLDVIAACAWVIPSQVVTPHCDGLTNLQHVDMAQWYRRGFDCAQQADVSKYRPALPTPEQ